MSNKNNPLSKYQFHITIATTITVILFIIGLSYQFATWKTTMEAKHNEFSTGLDHLIQSLEETQLDVKTLEDKSYVRDVDLARINTKLANIESLLLEIKSDLKNK